MARWWIPNLSDRAKRRCAWTAWGIYLGIVLLATGIRLREDPLDRVANHVYAQASERWWAQEDIYRPLNDRGFLYLPHSAILYTPFTKGNGLAAEILYRAALGILLALGLWTFSRIGPPGDRGYRFLVFTAVCLPLATWDLRQGQLNSAMLALMLMSATALAKERWTLGTALMGLAVAVKPLALVFVLLAGGTFPRRLGGRIALGAVGLFLLAYAFGPAAYVTRQYADFGSKMMFANAPPTQYYDLRGLLETGLGIVLPTAVLTAIRVLAALGLLGVAVRAKRRLPLQETAVGVMVLACLYLLVFNPKAEDPTYVLLGPPVGVAVVATGWFALGLLSYLATFSYELLGGRRYWFRPALALLLLSAVTLHLLGRAPPPPKR